MTARESISLHVLLNKIAVGELHGTRDGAVTFRFLDSYLRQANRPILGQWFEDHLQEEQRVRARVPAWFSNLLPEGALRQLLLRQHGLKHVHEFQMLALLGADDLPGAVRILTPDEGAEVTFDAHQEAAAPGADRLKFSLAGVQLKFSAVREGRGLTVPARGAAGDWIVKLPDPRHPAVPENEYSMMTWAAAAGLQAAGVELVHRDSLLNIPGDFFAGTEHQHALAVRRFDRGDGGRHIHMEDMAQVFNKFPDEKYGALNYETMGRLLMELALPEDVLELVRRVVFNALIGNGDAHVKNFSLLYENPVRAVLAPAYDLVSTIMYVPNDRAALNFAKSQDWTRLDDGALNRFASRIGLDAMHLRQDVHAFLDKALDRWRTHHHEWPVPAGLAKTLSDHWTTVPLIKAHLPSLA